MSERHPNDIPLRTIRHVKLSPFDQSSKGILGGQKGGDWVLVEPWIHSAPESLVGKPVTWPGRKLVRNNATDFHAWWPENCISEMNND
jgi:hypothetical protein